MTRSKGRVAGEHHPLLILERLHADQETVAIFSVQATVEGWLKVERTLANAQAACGVLSRADAAAIDSAAQLASIDLDELWSESRHVGYPILPLVRAVTARLPAGPDGRVHYGATTQDIMDTCLAMQLERALGRAERLVMSLGDAYSQLVGAHRGTIMAARTHGQQAVPTTLGAKVAVFLAQMTRHLERIDQVREHACVISLFGAGGTSAALGPKAPEIRRRMAEVLGLRDATVPWHVARDGIAEFGSLCALLSATCARFAREVIDLSRTEVGEVREPHADHRGASSTMPQKENPILSEAIVGFASVAGALSSALMRAMEAGGERAAGEWQVEWQVVPQVAVAATSCLLLATEIASGLRVYPSVMLRNLEADGGLLMAESYMMDLALGLGRERAHDVVYDASQRARSNGISLVEALAADDGESGGAGGQVPSRADAYLGSTEDICDAAIEDWSRARASRA